MPVASDPAYLQKRRVIERATASVGVESYFPMDHTPMGRPEFKVEETLERMTKSRLVLADLTLARPSCYFEVGLAQATHCPVLAVAQVGTELHQLGCREEVVRFQQYGEVANALIRSLSVGSDRAKPEPDDTRSSRELE